MDIGLSVFVKKKQAYDQTSELENDILFSTGDLADRGEESVSVLRFLLSLANFFPVLGNHDKYLLSYLEDGTIEDLWYFYNGGKETVGLYCKRRRNDY